MRGNLPLDPLEERNCGSIPACAGEPGDLRQPRPSKWVYPRVCGGTNTAPLVQADPLGLSRRVRGNPNRVFADGRGHGSIPACAGEPGAGPCNASESRVYPRVCGGTEIHDVVAGQGAGLSPRVRGNPPRTGMPEWRSGSIPACAGEPALAASLDRVVWVYPRVCGGTPSIPMCATAQPGLSPRVRGNPPTRRGGQSSDGSIPACAGEPARRVTDPVPTRVYPRVCGGTSTTQDSVWKWRGLSPRVRGNQLAISRYDTNLRSIPACAGEPRRASRGRGPAGVYPRVCGGTHARQRWRRADQGLSPRVRGNRSSPVWPCRGAGSIPACAGEPPKG